MTSGAVITAGGTVKIGTTAADPSGDTFTLIGDVVSIGEFGREYEVIEHQPVNERKTYKFKGGYNDGSLQLEAKLAPEDAGQDAVEAALNVDSSYNIQIELNDSQGVNGTIFDFKAKVTAFKKQPGSASDLVGGTISLEIDGDITETPAA